MKKLLLLPLLCLSLAAAAQSSDMSQHDRQKMMQKCMRDIDQSAMESLAHRSQEIELKIKSLCQAGKRDEAQNLAIEFGREIAANEEMEKMQRCGKMMRGMIPPINLPSEQEMKQHHICDGY